MGFTRNSHSIAPISMKNSIIASRAFSNRDFKSTEEKTSAGRLRFGRISLQWTLKMQRSKSCWEQQSCSRRTFRKKSRTFIKKIEIKHRSERPNLQLLLSSLVAHVEYIEFFTPRPVKKYRNRPSSLWLEKARVPESSQYIAQPLTLL